MQFSPPGAFLLSLRILTWSLSHFLIVCKPRRHVGLAKQGQQYGRTCLQGADRSPIQLRWTLSAAMRSEICWHAASFPTGGVALLFVFFT